MTELEKICIRAEIDGKWDSYTLQELYDLGMKGKPEAFQSLLSWLTNKSLDVMGIHEGDSLTPEKLTEAVHFLEEHGIRIVKLKN